MSKPKVTRVKREKAVKAPPDKASAGKEEKDEPVVKGKGTPEQNAQSLSELWSDWIWSEERGLYYRAKKSSPETWKYEFAEPPSIQGISFTETQQSPRYISPKVEYKKNEQKVIVVKERTYEVPGTAGGNYIFTKSGGGKAEGEKPGAAEERQAPASKNAGVVDGRVQERNVRVARVEEWRVEVNNAVQKVDPAENKEGGEKKHIEQERDTKLKKKDKHGEKRDSKQKARRK